MKLSLAILVCLAVAVVLAEKPVTVTVGYKDGGFIGLQNRKAPPFFLATTNTGAFVVNSSPRNTVLEITVPKGLAGPGKHSLGVAVGSPALYFSQPQGPSQ